MPLRTAETVSSSSALSFHVLLVHCTKTLNLKHSTDPDSAGKTFVGNTDFFLRNPDVDMAVWFFQFAFACALSSIVAGTVAERCKM